ncbi:hypothetical protein [Geodermatophilus sp. SYSU D00815]
MQNERAGAWGDRSTQYGVPAAVEGDAVPAGPTPNIPRSAAGRGAALLLALLGAGVALAPPAAAVDDLARPNYAVVQGPSCHPGGVRIEVVAGTAPYRVVLATSRTPAGEDAAEIRPGETVVLATADVAWGERIDSRLEFTALDDSGDTFADDLDPYTFTRPAEEDCAAIAPTTAGASPAPATVPGTAEDAPAPGGSAGAPAAGGDVPQAGESAPEATAEDGATDGGAGGGVPAPGTVPGHAPDPQVQPAAAGAPVAPVTREPAWPLIAAGVSLAGAAAGLGLTGARRARGERAGAGRPTAGA